MYGVGVENFIEGSAAPSCHDSYFLSREREKGIAGPEEAVFFGSGPVLGRSSVRRRHLAITGIASRVIGQSPSPLAGRPTLPSSPSANHASDLLQAALARDAAVEADDEGRGAALPLPAPFSWVPRDLHSRAMYVLSSAPARLSTPRRLHLCMCNYICTHGRTHLNQSSTIPDGLFPMGSLLGPLCFASNQGSGHAAQVASS